jgi:translocator protein
LSADARGRNERERNAQEAGGAALWLGLALSLAACFGAALFGNQFTEPAIPTWYASLDKPAWTPPNWLFGPVWTLLYISMAVAAWLVWRERGFGGAPLPLGLFCLQLLLNAIWSFLFFGLRNPGLAFAEIVLLWLAILATTLSFRRVNRTAALLLVPYLLWVTYASALNFEIWRTN